MTAAAVLTRETAAAAADVNTPPLTHGPAPGEYERRRRHRREIGSLRDQSETMLGKAVDRLLARDRLHAKSASPSARLLIVKAAKYGRYAQGLGALTRQFGTPQRTLVRLSVELRNDKRWLDRPHRGKRGEGVTIRSPGIWPSCWRGSARSSEDHPVHRRRSFTVPFRQK